MDGYNRAHKAQETKHKSYDKQKWEPSYENREDHKKALNIFNREARRSTEKFESPYELKGLKTSQK